jgi:DNA-directed RNA polymerase subunit RPC12/RpoP
MQTFEPLSLYLCSKCGSILKEANVNIEISRVNKDCPNCSALLSGYLKRQAKNVETNLSSAPKFQTAFDLARFKFDIKKIDAFMPLANTGSLCIIGYNANLLLTRLCLRALMPANHSGLDSPYVIVVNAGNSSDFYQTVNFIKQYGMNLHETLDRIIISRTFTIYQLKSLLLRELPKVIQKYQSSLVIVPGLLDLFDDPNIKKKEAKRVITSTMQLIGSTSNKLFVIATTNEGKYSSLILPTFEKRIILAKGATTNLNVDLYNQGRKESVTLTERELKIVRTR